MSQPIPFMERMRQIIYDTLRDENDKHYALDGPEVNAALEKIMDSINAEDIKHWYQLLVGYDEARMKDDMMYGDWRNDEMDFANNGQYKRV